MHDIMIAPPVLLKLFYRKMPENTAPASTFAESPLSRARTRDWRLEKNKMSKKEPSMFGNQPMNEDLAWAWGKCFMPAGRIPYHVLVDVLQGSHPNQHRKTITNTKLARFRKAFIRLCWLSWQLFLALILPKCT